MAPPAKSSQSNPELVEFRLDEQAKTLNKIDLKVDAGFAAINKRMDEFTFTPQAVTDKIDVRLLAVEKLLETDYVKKSDGKTIRGIGIAVITAICITLASLILNTVIKNGAGQ